MTPFAWAGAEVLDRHIGWSRVGMPPDAIAWASLAGAFAIALLLPGLLVSQRRRRVAVHLAAAVAALLSAGYVVAFLRGGPRIIDATTYFLQARALSEGHLAWSPGEPSASVVGRFLVRDVLGDGTHVAGIFPPGYPAYLALFMRLGVPMASGPVLAALLVYATAWLAREVAERLGTPGALAEEQARRAALPPLAAWMSALCAALRYHTADTMSHGLSALLATVSLAAALRMRSDARIRLRLALGGALGWLLATRPVTGAVVALVAAVLAGLSLPAAGRARESARAALFAALGALPGLALLLAQQHAATGAWLASSQSLYYALSDGPAGCFRYGFGAGIGCEHEHGTFVAANLPVRYGAYEAAATSLRRLKAHLCDPLSSEPAFLLVIGGAITALRGPRALRVLAGTPALLLLAYAPFYFDGNYPGGGARFLADLLPLEHVLALLAAVAIHRQLAGRFAVSFPRLGGATISLLLVGFALRASYDHLLLRDRDGGAPLYRPEVVAGAFIERGLVFVETDHGFGIGYDPDARAATGVEVVRSRGPALDTIAWAARGKPPAFRYVAEDRGSPARLDGFSPASPPLAVPGASFWPPTHQRGAFAMPRGARGRLDIAVDDGGEGEIEVALPRAAAGFGLTVQLEAEADASLELGVRTGNRSAQPVVVDLEGVGVTTPSVRRQTPTIVAPAGDGAVRLQLHIKLRQPRSHDRRAPVVALEGVTLHVSPY